MCAIAGVFGICDEAAVRRMMDAQAHRGPDDAGIWSDASLPATFGHRRLAILDLSSHGRQPMSYDNDRLYVTYNGEIYNFRELRSELQAHGYVFKTQTDTEVLLAAYAAWGPACLRRLRGMFAFAIADRRPPPGGPYLILARDRLGIKPLLYSQQGNSIWFASELRGVAASGRISADVNREALFDYAAVGSVSQPKTMFSEVKALPPGYSLQLRNGECHTTCYWDLHEATQDMRSRLRDIGEGEATALMREALQDAARAQLVADVPVGAFLSGGIDSTAVVGLMSQLVAGPVKTFSVGFEAQHGAIDERGYARLAAAHLGTEHHEVIVTGPETASLFPEIVAALDQPSLDGMNTWLVARAARRYVTVALSGLGGDEIFAGYRHFAWLRGANTPAPSWLPGKQAVLLWLQRLRRTTWAFRELLSVTDSAGQYAMLRRLMLDNELAASLSGTWYHGQSARRVERYRTWLREDADAVQQTSYVETKDYLLNTLLRDVDVMSMAHGLEVRPVLLDHHVVELAYSLPQHHKLLRENGKRCLVAATEQFLPAAVMTRSKAGFVLPVVSWMAGPLRDRFLSLLSLPNAKRLFQEPYLRRLRRQLRARHPPVALWAWGVMIAWLEQEHIELPL